MNARTFSPQFRSVIAQAREIAIDLGYDHISTLHFFLADCCSDDEHSIRHFCFANDEQLHGFTDKCRVGPPRQEYADKSLPLTLEAERAMTNAEKERLHHQQQLMYPCHLFVAAFKDERSVLHAHGGTAGPVEKIVAYYEARGAFSIMKITPGATVEHSPLGPLAKLRSWLSRK